MLTDAMEIHNSSTAGEETIENTLPCLRFRILFSGELNSLGKQDPFEEPRQFLIFWTNVFEAMNLFGNTVLQRVERAGLKNFRTTYQPHIS